MGPVRFEGPRRYSGVAPRPTRRGPCSAELAEPRVEEPRLRRESLAVAAPLVGGGQPIERLRRARIEAHAGATSEFGRRLRGRPRQAAASEEGEGVRVEGGPA